MQQDAQVLAVDATLAANLVLIFLQKKDFAQEVAIFAGQAVEDAANLFTGFAGDQLGVGVGEFVWPLRSCSCKAFLHIELTKAPKRSGWRTAPSRRRATSTRRKVSWVKSSTRSGGSMRARSKTLSNCPK